MKLIFCFTLLLASAFARSNDEGLYREDQENSVRAVEDDREDRISDSYDSPAYGASNVFRSGVLPGKSDYNVPAPAVQSSYSAYLASLGLLPYTYSPYSRYVALPYTVPPAYGAYGSYLNNPGYVSPFASGLGYTGYGSPYLGRSAYPGFGYGYVSGFGYPPAALRRGPAPVPAVPASVVGAPPAIPRGAAPFPAFANTIPGVPAPLAAALPYRAPLRAIQGKDGSVRYVPADI